MDVAALNNNLQEEAKSLLAKTNLLHKLEKYGNVELGGSYVYGTMVDRDIDLAVILDKKSINYALIKQVMNMLLELPGLDGIAMTDRAHFPKDDRPCGIWFGPILWMIDNKWNVDIWFVNQDEPHSHHNKDLHKRMLSITEAQRMTILDIKHRALIQDAKEKGITSTQIYAAVLDNNITSYEEFTSLTLG